MVVVVQEHLDISRLFYPHQIFDFPAGPGQPCSPMISQSTVSEGGKTPFLFFLGFFFLFFFSSFFFFFSFK